MANTNVIPIPLKKGIHQGQEASVLPPGFATDCRNWVPEPTGGMRARVPWLKGSTTSAPATKVGKGIGFHRKINNRMTPTRVRYATATNTTGTGVAAPTIAAATAGNLLVSIVVSWASGKPSPAVAAPAGFATMGTDFTDVGVQLRIQVFTKVAVGGETGASVTVNADHAGVTNHLYEWSGVRNVEDATATKALTSSTAVSVGPSTTPVASEENELFLLALHNQSTVTYSSLASGWEQEAGQVYGGSKENTVFYKVQTGVASAETFTATASAGQYAGRMLSLKAIVQSPTTTTTVLAGQQQSSSEMRVYGIDADDLGAGTWSLIDTISGLTSTTRPIAFTMGLGAAYYTHPGWSASRKYAGVGSTAAAVSGSPAGRCIAFNNNRLFVGGTDAEPYRLYFSAINDAATWPATNFWDFGARDGEAIEEITPFEDGLVVGKKTGIWFLAGTGPENFISRKLLGGGIAPGRTVIATPYGAVLIGENQVFLWDGSSVDKISDAIRSDYGMTGTYMHGSFIDGSVYINDPGSGLVFVLDMENGAWRIEEVASAATEGPGAVYNLDRDQYMLSINGSASFLSYRRFPGTDRGRDWDGLSETFTFTTPEIWAERPITRFTPHHLYVQVRQRGGSERDNAIEVVPIYDGVEYPAREIKMTDRTTFRERLDIAEQNAVAVENCAFRFTHVVADTKDNVCDIEGPLYLEFDTEPRY